MIEQPARIARIEPQRSRPAELQFEPVVYLESALDAFLAKIVVPVDRDVDLIVRRRGPIHAHIGGSVSGAGRGHEKERRKQQKNVSQGSFPHERAQ
jgi:hypothetical protein